MLSPIKPNKKAPPAAREQYDRDVANKKETPANWGFTGQRRLPAMVPVGAVPGAATAPKPERDPAREKKLKNELAAADDLEKRATRRSRVAHAISAILAGGEELGKDGKPDVARIQALLGEQVSAEERDRAWADIQELAAAETG